MSELCNLKQIKKHDYIEKATWYYIKIPTAIIDQNIRRFWEIFQRLSNPEKMKYFFPETANVFCFFLFCFCFFFFLLGSPVTPCVNIYLTVQLSKLYKSVKRLYQRRTWKEMKIIANKWLLYTVHSHITIPFPGVDTDTENRLRSYCKIMQ